MEDSSHQQNESPTAVPAPEGMNTPQTAGVVPQTTRSLDDPSDQVNLNNDQGSWMQIQDIHPHAKEEALKDQIKYSVCHWHFMFCIDYNALQGHFNKPFTKQMYSMLYKTIFCQCKDAELLFKAFSMFARPISIGSN